MKALRCLTIVAMVILCSCTALLQRPDPRAEKLIRLGAPIDSDEGQIKLAVLEYVGNSILKESKVVRFVPLSLSEIRTLGDRFRGAIRPAADAKYTKTSGWIDKVTHEMGTLLFAGGVRITGVNAEASAGYNRHGGSRFMFHLTKDQGKWLVLECKEDLVFEP